jgi:hypothetical protein
MIKVTFSSYSKVLKKNFTNTKPFNSLEDAQLFGMSMNWQIEKSEEI